jgi:hypothetical protein
LQRVKQLFLPTAEWGPAYMNTGKKKTTSDDNTLAVANDDASRYTKDNKIDEEIIQNDDDSLEMTSAKMPNDGIHVDSVNPGFVDDETLESRLDGDGSSRAMAANGSINTGNKNGDWSVASDGGHAAANDVISSNDVYRRPSTDQNDYYAGVSF